MTDYPSDYPQANTGTYAGGVDYGLLRSSVPAALPNQKKVFNSPRTNISMTFEMTNDEYVPWLVWMLTNGYYWFNMDIVSPLAPVDIFSNHSVRVTSSFEIQKLGDNWMSVSCAVEMLPADSEDPLAPARIEGDWVVAGSPASPSPDWLVGGSPSSPSPDWVAA
ncbi:unnamed protein product, partial [marine sediment metagenome]